MIIPSIDKGIPIPIDGRFKDAEQRIRYPFSEMLPGDSFLVSGGRKKSVKVAMSQYARGNGWKFTSRVQIDGTVRVWRVS
ncbi:hypothetical protein [Ochrobactrum chromiisoli]|uniref:Uncharacterized protein n=1 Tax=Ochrobactrum chromiisoli TaxID=2993941 RepID=A0ABT3QQN7_9HYPH|nr:hypothetical protein [Ochrobactrum chromiisoli]MCX2697865.1 hypothetical protein [Ochrobactrum chromiisoli]